jgi:chromate reductase, NAD(P)H dehydrogenase (quinone)
MTPRILVFAGSLRRDSYNKALARLATKHCREFGAETTFIDLADYPMPLYDGDLEAGEGPPENAFRLQELIATQHGLLIASPEYNNSLPALLKNTLDWVSRTPRVRGPNPFAGKVAALASASPGGFGGLRGLDHVRRVLDTVGMLVLPGVAAIPHADQAFDADGRLADTNADQRLQALCGQLIQVSGRLAV